MHLSMASTPADRHLDIGCGAEPHNPYRKAELHGVDIRQIDPQASFRFSAANLTLEPIPFPDSHFSSVSAFDFIEHVPRTMASADGTGTRFPFVELMNEVWRVLAPGGRFYALTPAFPSPQAFRDPTHVNFITEETHHYFVGDVPGARMYGFNGRFRTLRAGWAVSRDSQFAQPMSFRQKVRLFQHTVKGQLSHYLWDLEALKPAGTAGTTEAGASEF